MTEQTSDELERIACVPLPLKAENFNPDCQIPYGCEVQHIQHAMQDFLEFLGYINSQLNLNGLARLESILMPANFSSLVGEFMHTAITKYCTTLAKNRYHNGHPDLIPVGYYPDNRVQHGQEGIEIKASRAISSWQGHNAEAIWLMIFVFDSNRPVDLNSRVEPKPFRFHTVAGAQLTRDDWSEQGRSATSRRTPTASVLISGYHKMMANWIYKHELPVQPAEIQLGLPDSL